MHRTPKGEADADHANAASDRLVTRRRLLLGVAGGVGLLGGRRALRHTIAKRRLRRV